MQRVRCDMLCAKIQDFAVQGLHDIATRPQRYAKASSDTTEQLHLTPDADGRDQLVNGGGDVTFLIHKVPSWRLCSIMPRLYQILGTP